MKVKQRMQIMAILPIVLALVTSMILAWMTTNTHGIVLRLRATNSITRDVFLLDMVTHEYIKTLAPESQSRWQTIHARLVKTIQREIAASPRDQRIFKDINQSLNSAKSAFMDLSAHLAGGASPSSKIALNLLSLLRVSSQSIVDEALFLATNAHDQTIAIQMASFFMIIGTSSVLAILLVVIAVLVSRSIDNGLTALGDGTRQIAQGKLGYQVHLDNKDELGELAAAFNAMSRELKKDQETIQAEMTAREKITESLAKSNIQLSDAFTRLKRAQEEVIQQERLKVLKQFADGMLHDIYDAMMPILGFSELILRFPNEIKNTRNVYEHIQIIHDAVTKSISMAKHLSEYFYPTQKNNAGPINLKALLENVLSRVLPSWEEGGHRIAVKTESGEIPAFNSIELDINEALVNIITNAVEAMEETGTLTVRTRAEAGTIVIEVSDTGPGMTPETCRRCLEPFFSTKGHGHSGMGLTIAQGAIARCQGTLAIESLPDKGTTAIIRIPTMSAPAVVASAVAQLPLLDRKLRILVIDDEDCIRTLLMKVLGAMGYEAATAADGPAAIEMFRSSSFDVVIVDMAMPVMSGNEVAAAIKQIQPRTPVIMLTGFGDVLKERGEKMAGVDFLLSKPMPLGELQNAIIRAMIQSEGKSISES